MSFRRLSILASLVILASASAPRARADELCSMLDDCNPLGGSPIAPAAIGNSTLGSLGNTTATQVTTSAPSGLTVSFGTQAPTTDSVTNASSQSSVTSQAVLNQVVQTSSTTSTVGISNASTAATAIVGTNLGALPAVN